VTAKPVAIVGMACLFPKAPDVAAYWENIVRKVDAVGDPPPSRAMEPFLETREQTGLYCVRGGYIGDLAKFHPLEFGIMPSSVDGAEPDQFLALEVAHQTLLDAGVPDLPLNRERTEVILGRGTFTNRGVLIQFQHKIAIDQFLRLLRELHPEHTEEELRAIRERLTQCVPPITPETAAGMAPSLVSGRIANRFDLRGVNHTIDGACASSLIAMEKALQDLRDHRCDAALVGGVQVSTPAPIHNMFADMGALSRKPHLRPFDRDADGTMLGEGAGMLLLKRLEDAERDGNRVYALLCSVGTSSDGRARAILTPRVEGEELALRRAYEGTGIDPATVGLIEAHGTAMPVGDETEIQALRRVFGERRGAPRIALGTVKSMISHLLPASGAAGTIKAALALYHKVLPPTIHLESPNPKLEIEKTPFYFNTETRPWIHGGETPRRAGVNAFGFGGINAHAILEEHAAADENATASLDRTWDSELVILAGATREALMARGRLLQRYLERAPETPLRDVAATVNADLDGRLRLAIVAADTTDLARKLNHALGRLTDPSCARIKDRGGIHFIDEPLYESGKLAFLFPGEGSQYPNMLADLCMHFPSVRSRFDLMERAFSDHPRGYTPSQYIFPPPMPGEDRTLEEQERILWQMDGAVESVFVASHAMATLLDDLGLRPQVIAGHSAGEYPALLAAGATRVDDDASLIRMIRNVNKVYLALSQTKDVPQVVLIAVGGAEPALIESLVQGSDGKILVAMDNCRYQVVLSVDPPLAERTIATLRSRGAICTTLPFDRPYHTALFEPAYQFLVDSFPPIDLPRSEATLWSCATAAPYPREASEARRVALEQWIRQVRFRETIEAMYEDGVRIFVEVGPRGNLTSFVNDILRKRPFLAVASNLPGRSGITQLHHMLAMAAAQGVPMRLDALYRRRTPQRLDLEHGPAPEPRKAPAMDVSLALPLLHLGGREGLPAGLRPPAAAAIGPAVGHGAAVPFGAEAPVVLEKPPAPAAEQEAPSITAGTAVAVGGLDRVETAPAMQAYFNTMERFLAVQREVMHAFLDEGVPEMPAAGAQAESLAGGVAQAARIPADLEAPDAHSHDMPLVGEIVAFTPGRRLLSRRTLDPEEDRFLLDHTLGGRVSLIDPSLTALPVMPFTMTLEMAAEAAALLHPGHVLVGMRDARAHRWISFENGPVPVEIEARREGNAEIRVAIREAGVEGPAALLFEAIALFADHFAHPPAAGEFPLAGERASAWTPERLYRDGMFHGPAFQGVDSIDRVGDDGVEASLLALPAEGLFRANPAPRLLIDPALLDAAGQLVAFWNADADVRGINSTPFTLAALTLHGPPLPPGTRARGRALIARLAPDHLRADLAILGPDGRVHATARGWEDRTFDLPAPICALTSASRGITLSEPWPGPVAHLFEPEAWRCRRVIDWPEGIFEGFGQIWQKQLASLVLGRAEHEAFRALRRPPRGRTEWLLARAAVKDAVCDLLRVRHGIDLLPADVEIAADPLGRPIARGAWLDRVGRAPAVALAHGRTFAVGLACDGDLGLDVGIDAERMRALAEGFDSATLSEEERAVLDGIAPTAREEWLLRAWCAKEAAAKALGTGLAWNPKGLVVRKIDEHRGVVALEVGGEPARLRPEMAGATLEVRTLREGDLVAAITTCRRKDA